MEAFLKDVKHFGKALLKTPSFTITSIAALALGIASSTAIFSVVNTVLLKPFAYPDPERIVMFQNVFDQGGHGGTASPTEFNWWRDQTRLFQDVSAYSFDVANLTGDSVPELIQATLRSGTGVANSRGLGDADARELRGEPNGFEFDDSE